LNKKSQRFSIIRATFYGLVVLGIAFWITWKLFDREEVRKDSLRRIRERGYLIALTDRNTLNYFVYRGEPMGYQLALLESFARHLGVPLRIIAENNISKLDYYLNYHAADLIALNIPVTHHGRREVSFSAPFGETRLVLVQKKPDPGKKDSTPLIKSLKAFPADTVFVRQNPFLASIYHVFYKETGRRAILKEVTGVSQEDLVRQVSEGIIRFAVVQENVAMVLRRHYYNLDLSVLAFPLFSYGWAVSQHSDSLRREIDDWLKEFRNTKAYRQLYLDYFDNQRVVNFIRSDFSTFFGKKLSPYDDAIRQASRIVNWDWRLVASLIYEESNFRPGQVSHRNASGLMQLMPETAAKVGIDSLSSPAQQIAGGVKYLRYLEKQLPAEISDPAERIHFVLAAYNVGIGRVMAARSRAAQYGKDQNRWNRHVDYYLLRRSKKDPHGIPETPGSFPLDHKTEGFVDDIITRYFHYRNLVPLL